MTTKIDGNNGVLQSYDYQVLTTGFSYTFATGITTLIAAPAGTLAAGTITMPVAPADGTVITIDTSLDWRDRVLYGWVLAYGAATYPGNANDTNMNSGGASLYHFAIYTGTGATDAGAALVSNGNPPAIGYYTDMGVANVFIFCDTSAGGGKLRIYNNSGAVFYTPTVFIYATQDLGKR